MNHWHEVKNYFFKEPHEINPAVEGDLMAATSIDAWKTADDWEEGNVIACVMLSNHGDILVDYRESLARVDEMAQMAIQEAMEELRNYYAEHSEEPEHGNARTSNTTEKTYQALLYYGIEENESECSIFHAFRAEDPAEPHDDDAIAEDLASQLDCEPDDDCFQCRSMYINLPDSLVKKIQQDAVTAFLAESTESAHRIMGENTGLALIVAGLVNTMHCKEDVLKKLQERINTGTTSFTLDDFCDSDIARIVELTETAISLNEGYFNPYWNCVEEAINEFLEERKASKVPVARLDFLAPSGKITEGVDCFSEAEFLTALKKELHYGAPLSVVLYRNRQGKTISRSFLDDLDMLPKSVTEEDYYIEF